MAKKKAKPNPPKSEIEDFPDDAKIAVGETHDSIPPTGAESILNVCGRQVVVRRDKPMPITKTG